MKINNKALSAKGHRLSNVDFEKRTATCSLCGDVIISRGVNRTRGGISTSYWRCAFAYGRKSPGDKTWVKKHRVSCVDETTETGTCETCGIGVRMSKAGKDGGGNRVWRCYKAVKDRAEPKLGLIKSREHLISGVDEITKTGICKRCGPVEVRGSVGYKGRTRWRCFEEIRSRPGDPVKQRAHKLRINYGISVADYDAMFERQGGVCAICKESPDERDCLCVDHCHASDKIRSLLCRKCNTGLGSFRDSPDLLSAAIAYLNHHASQSTPSTPSQP